MSENFYLSDIEVKQIWEQMCLDIKPDVSEAVFATRILNNPISKIELVKNDDAIYLPNVDIEASVFSHRTLLFKGSEIYITPLEESLINKGGLKRNQVVGKWRCKKTDELIDDMYRRIYPR